MNAASASMWTSIKAGAREKEFLEKLKEKEERKQRRKEEKAKKKEQEELSKRHSLNQTAEMFSHLSTDYNLTPKQLREKAENSNLAYSNDDANTNNDYMKMETSTQKVAHPPRSKLQNEKNNMAKESSFENLQKHASNAVSSIGNFISVFKKDSQQIRDEDHKHHDSHNNHNSGKWNSANAHSSHISNKHSTSKEPVERQLSNEEKPKSNILKVNSTFNSNKWKVAVHSMKESGMVKTHNKRRNSTDSWMDAINIAKAQGILKTNTTVCLTNRCQE